MIFAFPFHAPLFGFCMKRFFQYLTLLLLSFALAHCAPNSATQFSTPTVVASPTAQLPNNPTIEPPTMQPPQAQLVLALELAANEMSAAQNSVTLDEARAHAEAVVNILVGKRGRWYGDQDGDGSVNDPLKGRGVLPGEIQTQGADVDNTTNFSAGLALMAVGTNPNPPPLTVLLGDVKTWRGQPRAGYDQIANALANANASPQLDALQGSVPRAVAFARLLLTNARTMEEARAFAAEAVKEMEEAVGAARELAQ